MCNWITADTVHLRVQSWDLFSFNYVTCFYWTVSHSDAFNVISNLKIIRG